MTQTQTNTLLLRYADFAPTQFDERGLALPDRQDWLVAPVAVDRDSGPLDQSNFACALRQLGGESADVEVHRFRHWGPGWFEIIIVRPDTDAAGICEALAATLADYPVLDEEDFSLRELEAADDYWRSMGMRDRVQWCRECGLSIFAARRDEMPADGELVQMLAY